MLTQRRNPSNAKVTRQLRKKMKNLQKINLKAWKCDLNDREFKIAILKKLNKLQKNTGSLINSK